MQFSSPLVEEASSQASPLTPKPSGPTSRFEGLKHPLSDVHAHMFSMGNMARVWEQFPIPLFGDDRPVSEGISDPFVLLSKVIGVEPSGANAMALSLQKGERITLSRVDAFADGVAVKQVRRLDACLARLVCHVLVSHDVE